MMIATLIGLCAGKAGGFGCACSSWVCEPGVMCVGGDEVHWDLPLAPLWAQQKQQQLLRNKAKTQPVQPQQPRQDKTPQQPPPQHIDSDQLRCQPQLQGGEVQEGERCPLEEEGGLEEEEEAASDGQHELQQPQEEVRPLDGRCRVGSYEVEVIRVEGFCCTPDTSVRFGGSIYPI